MRILVFLQGTILMHRGGVGRTREERVRQVYDREKTVFDWPVYAPIGRAAEKLRRWKEEGAEIAYLSAHRIDEDVRTDEVLLKNHGFPDGQVFHRETGEEYRDVVERVQPNVLIEDDCESIGGEKEMVYPNLRPSFRNIIRSVVVEEFGGIDQLPDDIAFFRTKSANIYPGTIA